MCLSSLHNETGQNGAENMRHAQGSGPCNTVLCADPVQSAALYKGHAVAKNGNGLCISGLRQSTRTPPRGDMRVTGRDTRTFAAPRHQNHTTPSAARYATLRAGTL